MNFSLTLKIRTKNPQILKRKYHCQVFHLFFLYALICYLAIFRFRIFLINRNVSWISPFLEYVKLISKERKNVGKTARKAETQAESFHVKGTFKTWTFQTAKTWAERKASMGKKATQLEKLMTQTAIGRLKFIWAECENTHYKQSANCTLTLLRHATKCTQPIPWTSVKPMTGKRYFSVLQKLTVRTGHWHLVSYLFNTSCLRF